MAFWSDAALQGTELFRGRCVEHRFAPHFHETFVVAVFEAGVQRWSIGRETGLATPGAIMVIPPGETHTGRAHLPEGWCYRAWYPSVRTLERAAEDVYERPATGLSVRCGVTDRPRLAARLIELHARQEAEADALARQSAFAAAMESILQLFGGSSAQKVGTAEHAAVRRATEFLEERFGEDVHLDDIARHAGLSAYRLMHLFKASKGITLHGCLTQVRLHHAREKLRRGDPAAQVAADVGFADQAHFIRHFKKRYGVTPGAYCRASR